MYPERILLLVFCVSVLGGAYYLATQSVWAESADLDRSVRLGAPGGVSGVRVK